MDFLIQVPGCPFSRYLDFFRPGTVINKAGSSIRPEIRDDMGINFLAGIIISALLLFFAFHNISFHSVLDELKNLDTILIIPLVALGILVQFLRSYRWGLLLKPLHAGDIGQMKLFSITSVGFLAIMALPARIGELARPYLISNRTGIRMPSALATVVVERIFDILTVLVMFLAMLYFFTMPQWLAKSVIVWTAITAAGIAVLVPSIRTKLLRVCEKLPGRFSFLEKWIGQFDRSLTDCTGSGKDFIRFLLITVIIWLANALWFYLLILAFGFNIPVQAAFIMMIVIIIGIAIPSAPGFIGNWHFACLTGLAIFGVPKEQALGYAVVSHFLTTMTLTVLGLACLPANNVKIMSDLGRIKEIFKREAA